MKYFLECKADGERLQVNKKQLIWLIEHATDRDVTSTYNIVVVNEYGEGRYSSSKHLDALLKVLKQ
jgi:hypothetical protein